MTFGKNLKEIRIYKGLNQNQLAHLLNTSQQHISQLENNHREPNLEDLKKLSSIFELPADMLIQESPYPYNLDNLDEQLEALLAIQSHSTKILIRDLLLRIKG